MSAMTHAIRRLLWLLVLVAAAARAQSEAGTFAAVQGTVEVQRTAGWQPATIGMPVLVGDQVRTGANSRTKVVFRDDSVLDVAPNTEVTLQAQFFDESNRRYRSLLRLAVGKIRAWVSEYYHAPRARYEVETPTAVAGVRGTEFIILYDPSRDTTEVVGLVDQVEVSSRVGVAGKGVMIGPRLYTQVLKNKEPSPPQRVDDSRLDHFLEGIELVGTGRRDGLNVLHPAVMGRVLAAEDVPGGAAGGAAPAGLEKTAEGLRITAPKDLLANRLSQDVYTNTQPLIDFKQTPPGNLSQGGVKVGF